MEAVRDELRERRVEFAEGTGWQELVKKLKTHEGDNKYFRPLTSYDSFKWNSTHFGPDGEVLAVANGAL